MKRWSADSPLYGVVPVFGVFAVRVEEDVLIYSSTEAEHVWCRMFTRLQNLQHHSEGLFPVSRTVPPVHKHTHNSKYYFITYLYTLCNISGQEAFTATAQGLINQKWFNIHYKV